MKTQTNIQRPIWLRAKRSWVLMRKGLNQTTYIAFPPPPATNVRKYVFSWHQSLGELSVRLISTVTSAGSPFHTVGAVGLGCRLHQACRRAVCHVSVPHLKSHRSTRKLSESFCLICSPPPVPTHFTSLARLHQPNAGTDDNFLTSFHQRRSLP